VGDVLLDVTVPDRATARIIRAAIETAIPTDGKSGVELRLPPEPQPGAGSQPDYRLSGMVVIDGLSDSEAAEKVEGALRMLPEIEYRGSAAGVAAFVVCLRGRGGGPAGDRAALEEPDGVAAGGLSIGGEAFVFGSARVAGEDVAERVDRNGPARAHSAKSGWWRASPVMTVTGSPVARSNQGSNGQRSGLFS
jgi:hypothetical protein